MKPRCALQSQWPPVHDVGELEDRLRDLDAKLGGPAHVDRELDLGNLLHRQVSGCSAGQDAVDETRAGASNRSHVDAQREQCTLVEPFLPVGLYGQAGLEGEVHGCLREVESQARRQQKRAADLSRRQRVERRREIGLRGRVANIELNPELVGGLSRLHHEGRGRSIVGIHQREQPPQPRHDLVVELELLGDGVSCAEDAGQVCAGMRERLDEAGAHGIGRVKEDDGDACAVGCCRALRSLDRRVLERDDHVHAIVHEDGRLALRLTGFEVAPEQFHLGLPDAPLLDKVGDQFIR